MTTQTPGRHRARRSFLHWPVPAVLLNAMRDEVRHG